MSNLRQSICINVKPMMDSSRNIITISSDRTGNNEHATSKRIRYQEVHYNPDREAIVLMVHDTTNEFDYEIGLNEAIKRGFKFNEVQHFLSAINDVYVSKFVTDIEVYRHAARYIVESVAVKTNTTVVKVLKRFHDSGLSRVKEEAYRYFPEVVLYPKLTAIARHWLSTGASIGNLYSTVDYELIDVNDYDEHLPLMWDSIESHPTIIDAYVNYVNIDKHCDEIKTRIMLEKLNLQ